MSSFLPQLETFTVPESESDASHAKKVDKIKSSIRQGPFLSIKLW